MTSPYLTSKEAAEYLRFPSVESLYQAIPRERIPCVRRGSRTLLFRVDQLERWLAGERTDKGAPVRNAAGPRLARTR